MRYLIAAAVTLLIIIVPLGSWYYLQTGLNYRKASLEELKPKGPATSIVDDEALFKGKTTLLYNNIKFPELKSDVEIIFEQYQSGLTFQLVELSTRNVSQQRNNHIILNPSEMDVKIKMDNALTLIDTSGQVRRSYLDSKDEVSKSVAHLAIVIPLPKRQDIRMKNGNDVDATPGFIKRSKEK